MTDRPLITNDLRPPAFPPNNVANDIIALIQPLLLSWSECFLSFARAWTRGKILAIATELGRRLAQVQQQGKIFFLYQGRSSLYCCAVYPCDIAVWLQFPVLGLVFRYYCSGVNIERVRGPTVSLGAVGPREFDLLTPAAQHNVLLCVILKYGV